ncbi:polysaccharide ABC transporter ATP-binding protein [Flavobacterium sp.]|uniref:ABC transporter ATP-binding protein n=1 Tax=Flavobacterium sp. TaxID=239 RepID=UPI00262BDE5A|nr:polysaccharide ABC transporter ATP-binding protein [Flavobacterium sp.]
MSKIVIKAEDISKQYRLGLVGTGTVKDDMKRWWYNLRGKEDPFLKIGEANNRATKSESDYVWSLRDINFEINQGDSVGIIGRNGAGKSTLLKILSQVTQPTTGKIYTKGRIASLLEVGTGFHPEMTGRENIFLNGAILGMRKAEIKRKFDEIVDFSGVERYIDTPVKRYSSGMYVRLAFAVAAHLESEILIVDEVLAVGDAEFQKKCLGKMNDVSKGEGRTVLFVSHNMGAIKTLCNKGIVLDNGGLIYEGGINESVDHYSSIELGSFDEKSAHKSYHNQVEIIESDITNDKKPVNQGASISLGDKLELHLKIAVLGEISDLSIAMDILNVNSELIAHMTNEDDGVYFSKLRNGDVVDLTIETGSLLFVPGLYRINLWIGSSQDDTLYTITNLLVFHLEQSSFTKRTKALPKHSKMYLPTYWKIN